MMETEDEKGGFVEGKGTHSAIYTLRTLTERFLEVQKDLFMFH